MSYDLSNVRPATDLFLLRLTETVGEIQAHDHPASGPDLYCLNLTSFLGERMGAVLRRLADEQAEAKSWRERHTALADEFAREVERLQGELALAEEQIDSMRIALDEADAEVTR